MQYILLIGIAFVLGLEHALETDHVLAVTTLTSQTRSVRRAVLLAALWGLGHSITLFVVTLVILVLKVTIPAQLASFFEFLVGLLLVVLGANVFRTILKGDIHLHAHEHDGTVHTHLHSHVHTDDHNHHRRGSLLAGIVHGLAGSTALLLLVVSSFSSTTVGLIFIFCFGAGSILGMCLITTLISIPIKLTLNAKALNRAIQFAAGGLGIAGGLFIMVNIALAR